MTPQTTPERPRPARRRIPIGLMIGLVALLGCLAVLYGLRGGGKKDTAACEGAAATIARLDPFVHGEVAALSLQRPSRPAPDLAFKGPDGRDETLANYKGKIVLLNLWATWCIPCRTEMPALDKLQAQLGGADFQVVPVNIDTAKLDRPKAFLDSAGITHLPLLTDPTANVFQVLRQEGQALGLPTTLVLDRQGCELGVMAGPAGWDSPEAEKLIEAAKTS